MTLPALLAALAGCVDRSASETMSVDVPASQLSLEPSIIDSDPAASDGMMPVVVQFFHGNDFVQLANASVMCNGVAMPWGGLGYAARIPIPAAGSNLVFVHTRAGMTAMAKIKVPARPVITSPASGAVLTRSSSFAIDYVPSSSVGVRPSASDGTVGVDGAEQPDVGKAYVDVSGLHPGAGAVSIAGRFLSTVAAGTGFQAVVATYTISSADITVTWQ